jgi:hypothetical protein
MHMTKGSPASTASPPHPPMISSIIRQTSVTADRSDDCADGHADVVDFVLLLSFLVCG